MGKPFPFFPTIVSFAAVSVCLAVSVPARASSPSDQYLAVRRANPPRPRLTLRALATAEDPAQFGGATLEMQGRLTGIIPHGGDGSSDGDNEGATLLFTTDSGDEITPEMSALPAGVRAGDKLRLLVVVVPPDAGVISGGMPDLKVVAVASASDIAAAELRAEQNATRRAARDKQTQAALRAADSALNRSFAAPLSPSHTPNRSSVASRGADGATVRSGAPLFAALSDSAKAAYPRYLAYVRQCNRRLTDEQADAIATSILLFSERYAVDPRLMVALIIAESDFKPRETSNKGAMGLGQLMPDEAQSLGLSNPYDPTQNIAGAVYLMRGRLDKYSGGGDLTMNHIILALASYNAGMGAVKKYGGVPPYRETQNYVKKIERIYRELCGMAAPS